MKDDDDNDDDIAPQRQPILKTDESLPPQWTVHITDYEITNQNSNHNRKDAAAAADDDDDHWNEERGDGKVDETVLQRWSIYFD